MQTDIFDSHTAQSKIARTIIAKYCLKEKHIKQSYEFVVKHVVSSCVPLPAELRNEVSAEIRLILSGAKC
jgi:hypothetical protein